MKGKEIIKMMRSGRGFMLQRRRTGGGGGNGGSGGGGNMGNGEVLMVPFEAGFQ